MKKILIIVAPFGFGPSSIALILADFLRARYAVSIASFGSALPFLRANAPDDVAIVPGRFRTNFPNREALAGFHAFIAVNQMPALHYLATLGLAGRSIFFDSIAQWRAEFEPASQPDGLLAYIVHDEFSASASERPNYPAAATVVRPLLWAGEVRPLDEAERRGVLVHTGGMTSPAAGSDPVNLVATALIGPVVASLVGGGHEVALMGNADVFARLPRTKEARLLGSVSPAAAFQAIAEAKLLVTTPGMGAVYEAMATRTPIVLLPPTNSTQLQHYGVLTRRGIVGVLAHQARDALSNRLSSLPWQQQTPALLKILAQNGSTIAHGANAVLDAILAGAGSSKLEQYLARTDALWSSLSPASPRAAITGALDRLS